MPFIQETFSENIRPGLAGAVANMVPSTIISRDVETVAGIGFGKAVAKGTADKGIVVPTGTAVTIGFTVRDQSAFGAAGIGNGYAQRESAAVMTKGVIWVEVGQAVTAGDPVYVVPTTGAIRKDNTGSAILVPNGVFDTSAANGALAQLRLL